MSRNPSNPEAFPERIFKPPSEIGQNHKVRPHVAAFVAACAKSRRALRMNVVVDGLENIPETGSFIFAPDHHSFYDALVNGIMLEDGVFKDRVRGDREVYFSAKSEIWEFGPAQIVGRALQPIIEPLGAVATRRKGGGTERFIEDFTYLLEHPRSDDGVLEIAYPGGTRVATGATDKIRTGVTRLSRETGTPVIPVGQVNTELVARQMFNPLVRTDIGVKIGEPFYPSQFDAADPEEAVANQNFYMLESIKGLTRQAGEMIGQE
ncbi:MAG TPA: lysophospholipid acyltransferase family protein [Candidatus Saccharimonadales bacterium]|nr:lysophospholipid acyltransferase family protein [Candidatus Saccharimonadales bacterium]